MDPPVAGEPKRQRRNSPPRNPPNLGSLNYPFVYVPGDGTRIGRFVPKSGAEFSPLYSFPGQPFPPPWGEEKEHLPGPSTQTVENDVSSANPMPGTTMPIDAAYPPYPQQSSWFPQQPPAPWHSPYQAQYPQRPPGRRLTPSLGPPFRRREYFEWGIDFYIRIDHAACHHVYPHVGGPFPSLQEAEQAIERYLHDRRDPKMFTMDNVSPVDIAVRQSLYFPDGTRRRRLRSAPVDEIRDSKLQLVRALVDKYNEDNCLLGDLAYELNAVGCYESFCEGDFRMWYHHMNFTASTKGAVSSDVFFAEVIFTRAESEELPVSCLCVIKPTDDANCFGCTNHGSFELKHPNDVGYAGGHVMNMFMPIKGPKIMMGCFEEESLEAEEARLRSSLQCLNNPQISDNLPGSLAKKYPGPPKLLGGMQQRGPLSFPSGGAPMQYFAPPGWSR